MTLCGVTPHVMGWPLFSGEVLNSSFLVAGHTFELPEVITVRLEPGIW